jgi:iron complex outermembrane receptor protein
MQIFPKHLLSSPLCLLAAPIFIFSSSLTAAPTALEEVIVTAQKREQGLIEVPISISVIDGKFIEDRGLLSMAEVTQHAPNVSLSEQVLGFSSISMRGFSGGVNRGFEQSVGLYVDGVFSGRTASGSSDLSDIERVEILRGPQGTLFGNNTIAGSFNIVTKSTNREELEGNLTLSGGSYDYVNLNGSLSGPISETLSFRVSLGHREEEGSTDNLGHSLGEADRHMGNLEKEIWRFKLDWHPLENLSLELASSGEDGQSNMSYGSETYLNRPEDDLQVKLGPLSAYALPTLKSLIPNISFELDDREVAHNEDTQFELATRAHSLTVEYGLGEHQLRSITALTSYDDDNLFDADFSPVNMLARTSEESYKQLSQELQWISPQYDNFSFLLGVFWLESELEVDSYLEADFNEYSIAVSTLDIKYFDQDYRSAAAYGQATYDLNDRWSVTGGLRYSDEKKSADIIHTYEDCFFLSPIPLPPDVCGNILGAGEQFAIDAEMQDSNTSPMLSLGFQINDQWNSYLRYARGYKSGGFSSEDFYVGESRNEFEPEDAVTYEAGIKGRYLGGAGRLSAAVFYTDFDNLQVSLFNGVGFTVGNAAEATSQGFELESQWMASETLMLSGALGYTDASYDKYRSAPCTIEQIEAQGSGDCLQDLTGKEMSKAPQWNANASALYTLPMADTMEWQFGLDLIYSDEHFTDIDLDDSSHQDAYTLINARIALADVGGRWQVNFRGTNLGDETVMTGSVDLPFLAGAFGGRVIDPRRYFIDLKASF